MKAYTDTQGKKDKASQSPMGSAVLRGFFKDTETDRQTEKGEQRQTHRHRTLLMGGRGEVCFLWSHLRTGL